MIPLSISSLTSRFVCHQGMSCGMPRYVVDVALRVGFSAYYLMVRPSTFTFHLVAVLATSFRDWIFHQALCA
eukprot:4100442-Pyramimonas_sp.AAC.1